MMQTKRSSGSPTIGIVTALPREFRAVMTMLGSSRIVELPGKGADHTYALGTLPSKNGRHLVAVLLLPDIGNTNSGIGAALMTSNYPSVECVFMVGIAGGVPDALDPSEHVRLGDVVVSGRDGVVQYDIGKMLTDRLIAKPPPRPPSARMLQATRILSALNYEDSYYRLIDESLSELGISRPSQGSDVLGTTDVPSIPLSHPLDPSRTPGRPRVFIGTIASANQVLKNAARRDQLRNEHRAKAVEMEGSGIADLAWTRAIEYFVVRGICDYCDSNKRDDWQDYAAVVAAAYTRVLLSTVSSPAKRLTRRTALIASMVVLPMAAISAYAVLRGTGGTTEIARLYVEAIRPPVELKVNGKSVRSLTAELPFTSVDVHEGEHRVIATFAGQQYEEIVTVKRGATAIVRIPPFPR